MEVSKKDWKLFMQKIASWQENYMDQLAKEYIELLNSDKKGSEKFWTLEKRIKQDKRKKGVLIELRKSMMIQDICELLQDEVIKMEDLEEFSDDLKEAIKLMMR